MTAGKGSSPRPVKGDRFRRNWEDIFRKPIHEQPMRGEVIEGHEYLGNGGWHTIDQHDEELRAEKP